ncbi:MAG: glycosyltransferase family 2 protein [Thermodesulfobacteriota bacterium]
MENNRESAGAGNRPAPAEGHPSAAMEGGAPVSRHRIAVVIPVYNHESKVAEVVRETLKLRLPVIVVNDGSTDKTGDILRTMDGIRIMSHDRNLGKGAAIVTGLVKAAETADWAVTLDADGQHNPGDARLLIRASMTEGRALIVGRRTGMRTEKAPWTSRFGRGFSNFWVWAAGGPRMTDSQSGFRLYPLPETLHLGVRSRRFQFEVEVLVKAQWKGLPVTEIPVGVVYQSGGRRISHFRPFVDFMRNTATFGRLIVLRLFLPGRLRRRPAPCPIRES